MGLAASQARLLTITSRKSDCEYQSMRLSHEKIALSREMTEISNEYQKSLNQSNLYYDFYGTGDMSNPLTYGLLMSPSALNDYLPTLICNQQGRVVLDGKYAAAAKAAGIPQEGLGALPSEEVRNAFIEGLFQNGIITKQIKDAIQASTYNQAAGLGSIDMITVNTVEGNIDTLLEYIRSTITEGVDVQSTIDANNDNIIIEEGDWKFDTNNIDLYKLLSGEETYTLFGYSNGEDYFNHDSIQALADYMRGENMSSGAGFIDQLYEQFSQVLDVGDGRSGMALKYALTETKRMFDYTSKYDENTNANEWDYLDAAGGTEVDNHYKRSRNHDAVKKWNTQYIGIVESRTKHDWWTNGAGTALNLNNVVKAFLTNFASYMEGISKQTYTADIGNINKYDLVTNDKSYIYKIRTGSQISGEEAKMALFYDTLFNQLCTKGWTENNEVNDKEYLKEMLKSGMMFITSVSDDGYYNMDNFSTNTYLKEVSDDSAIAEAEAKYKTQKSRLTAKEDELDLKMKNLDTEISSLTTEYDSVKSVITKNIEKSFKRYNA